MFGVYVRIGLCLFILFAFSYPTFARLSSGCDTALHSDDNEFNYTENFLSYLIKLLNEGVLKVTDLQLVIQDIESLGKVQNPLKKQDQSKSASFYHSQTIQDYIDSNHLDLQKVLAGIQNILRQQKQTKAEQEKARDKTKVALANIKFHPIRTKGKLKHSFEMMETVVTQQMWLDLMQAVPEYWFSGPSDVPATSINGVQYWPDYPANGVNFWTVLKFANKLSIQQRLTPVYDTSKLDFSVNLVGPNGKMIINAPDEDIYQAEGYRLPTKEEIESIVQDHDLLYDKSIRESSWVAPVGEMPALMVDGYSFYDLHDNKAVSEWLYDDAGRGTNGDQQRLVLLKRKDFPLIQTMGIQAASSGNMTSFRLVRTIKNEK